MLNDGAYPEKATLRLLRRPVRRHRLPAAPAAVRHRRDRADPAQGAGRGPDRARRSAGASSRSRWSTALTSPSKGGGLGAITAADGAVAFGAIVALIGGVLPSCRRASRAGSSRRPSWTWQFDRVGRVGRCWSSSSCCCCSLVAAVLTSGGQGGAANVYAGRGVPVLPRRAGRRCSRRLHASGAAELGRARCPSGTGCSACRAAGRRAGAAADRGGQRVLDDGRGQHRRLRRHGDRAQHRRRAWPACSTWATSRSSASARSSRRTCPARRRRSSACTLPFPLVMVISRGRGRAASARSSARRRCGCAATTSPSSRWPSARSSCAPRRTTSAA